MLRLLDKRLIGIIFTLWLTISSFAAQVPHSTAPGTPSAEDVRIAMMRASSIISRFDNVAQTCGPPVSFCPPFLNQLIQDDKADGYFVDFNFLWVPDWRVRMGAILDSRYPSCARLMDPKFTKAQGFASSRDMQQFSEKRMFASLGENAHSAVRACTSNNDAGDQSKTSKFYYASSRLSQGMQDAQTELAKIDAILGDGSSLGKCESVFSNVKTQCQQLKSCAVSPDTLDNVVAQSDIDEKKYHEQIKKLKQVENLCLSEDKILRNCHYIQDSSTGLGDELCDKPDPVKYQALQKRCDQEQAPLASSIALLEKVNPWFTQSEFFEGRKKNKSSKDLIKSSLGKTRKALKAVRGSLETAAQCLTGAKAADCRVSDFREALGSTKWMPWSTGRGQENSVHMAMAAQQCIEEGAVDRDNTAHTLRTAGRDALLTLGTMGIGGVVLKGAQLAGKGLETASLAKQVSTLSAVGVDILFFGESAAHAINNCALEYDKQKVSLETNPSTGLQCPNPLANKLASEKAGESCKSSLIETAMNAAPLAPMIARAIREARWAERPSGWIDTERRRPDIPVTRKTAESARPLNREDLIRQNLTTEFTTVRQNEEWMRMAENTQPDGKTKYFEVENSVMKELNDVTQDKNFVTALTNKHKSITKEKIDAFAKKYPSVDVIPYSDFKSMRYALKPRPPATKLPAEIEKELARVLQDANDEFVKYMRDNKLLRETDKPEEWFRAGIGETADQATQASRYSRQTDGPNRLQNFSNPQLQENLNSSVKATETVRNDLQRQLKESSLMENIAGTDKMTFKPEVFDAVRKTKTPTELMDLVQRSSGVKITELQAKQIRDYADLVDDFSPGIHVAERKFASLADSANGGLSLDFAGMGSRNSRATAEALALSDNLGDAVIRARNGEKGVTNTFAVRKADVQIAVGGVLKKYGIEAKFIDSGDDMVIKPSKPIPATARQEIADALAKKVPPSSIRVSHVPAGVERAADRALIGTHGESIEKEMRKTLQGVIPKEKLDGILFQIDMLASSAGNGHAELMIGKPNTTLDPRTEIPQIQEAFRKAIEKVNRSLRLENKPGNYVPSGALFNFHPIKSWVVQMREAHFGKPSQTGIFGHNFIRSVSIFSSPMPMS